MNRLRQILLGLLGMVIIVLVSVSFLPTWPEPVSYLNLVLSVILFLAVMVGERQALWCAVGCGFFLEFYSALPFGTTLLSLIVTVVVVNMLFRHVVTNRSLYSLLLLSIAGVLAHALSAWLLGLLLRWWSGGSAGLPTVFQHATATSWQVGLQIAVLTVFFFCFTFFHSRFQSRVRTSFR